VDGKNCVMRSFTSRMRCAGYVVCMGLLRNAHNILVRNLKGRDCF
jgi:hypothetical protein